MAKKSISMNAVLSIIKQIMAILFPMITVYYASRVLGANNFGNVNYVRSIVSYFSLAAVLGIPTYAIREGAYYRNQREKYADFANQIFTINIWSTVLVLVGLVICIAIPKSVFRDQMALVIIFGTSFVFQTLGADWVNSTFEDYWYITVRYIMFNAISVILLFAFVKSTKDVLLYAAILVFASSGGNLLNMFYIRRYVKLKIVPISFCYNHMIPIFLLFSVEVATTIYINSDTTMLGAMIDTEAVAIYTVVSNIYIAIKRVVNAAITVTLPRLSFYIGNGDMEKYGLLFHKVTESVIIALLPCMTGIYILSRPLVVFMGGEKYAEGSFALQILSIALFFAVIAYVLSRCVLLPAKRDKTYMIATLLSAGVNIGLNILLIPKYSYNGAAVTTLISEAVVCVIMLYDAHKFVKIKIDVTSFCKTVIGCIFILIVCNIILHGIKNNFLAILVSFFGSVIVYVLVLIVLRHPLYLQIKAKMSELRNRNVG